MHQSPTKLSRQAALLLHAYCEGIFPMADDEFGDIGWYLPQKRGIIPLDRFHIPKRLAKTIRQAHFEVTFDRDFLGVIRGCAQPAPGREETWISDEIIGMYAELHTLGFAHSVEIWREQQLIGGLYGVALRGLFAGESMFSRARDASKIALVYLVKQLRQSGFVLLDTQFYTPHLGQFGAIEVSNESYQRLLQIALQVKAHFGTGAPTRFTA